MLIKLRTRHIKIIFRALVVIIIPVFIFWGGSSLRRNKKNAVGEMAGHPLTSSEFSSYIAMARLLSHLRLSPEERKKISSRDIIAQAQRLLLLSWKAKKDNIKVSDEEVVHRIKTILFGKKAFNKEIYLKFLRRELRMQPKVFEEYTRKIIATDKVQGRYITVEVTDKEIKDAYLKDTQKAKISYLFLAYDKFKDGLSFTAEEIKQYYNKNKSLFKEPAKVKIKYAEIKKDSKEKEAIEKALPELKNIEELKEKFSLEVKESGFFGLNDAIKGAGWNPKVNNAAFSLAKNKIYGFLEGKDSFLVIEKTDEKPSYIPDLKEIYNEVEKKLKQKKAREKAKKEGEAILAEIKGKTGVNLKKLAKKRKIDFKETDYFKYYDYIEGLGLDENLSRLIFSLKEGSIYPSVLLLLKGAYIIKLEDITPFDEKELKKNVEKYRRSIYQSKSLLQYLKFLSRLQKEAQLKIYLSPDGLNR